MRYPADNSIAFAPTVTHKAKVDELVRRMANDVIGETYRSAREAATANKNVVEYAGYETDDEKRLSSQYGNFTKAIADKLNEMGYDKFGKQLSSS